MSIHDKSDLFFHDYNIAGLFVQENYLSVVPKVPKDQILERVAKISRQACQWESLVERAIREKRFGLYYQPQACYSSVIPGSLDVRAHWCANKFSQAGLDVIPSAINSDRILQRNYSSHATGKHLDGIAGSFFLWPGQRDPFQVIDSKVRAAFALFL
ncbi:hypothetical protein KQX54_001256 [Cotesia glomerata]|uniref:Uncharacterized protein n=1 Tax=Cotesia glomerata TaxID=32391 RepID=A0AAV7HZK7_COTGL|nr:hypothetical protein KQX54_001256 [Cotesia glomerata]